MVKIDYNYSYEDEKNLTDEEYEAQIAEKTSIWSINRDYLPKKVDTKALGKSYLDYRENKVYVLDGNATIINEKKKDLQLEFDIENWGHLAKIGDKVHNFGITLHILFRLYSYNRAK